MPPIDVGTVMISKEDGHKLTVRRIDASMATIRFHHLKGVYAVTHESLLMYYKQSPLQPK